MWGIFGCAFDSFTLSEHIWESFQARVAGVVYAGQRSLQDGITLWSGEVVDDALGKAAAVFNAFCGRGWPIKL